MKIHYFIAVFIATFAIFSCAAEKDKVASLKKEVIAVHDEVMPRMGELRNYQKLLKEAEQKLVETPVDSIQADEFRQASIACEEAYEGMFVWMRQFDAKLEGMDEEASLGYLEDQLLKVTEVNYAIKKAISEAERLLAE
jgi:hypothetical protein